jgi:hypothetical protein
VNTVRVVPPPPPLFFSGWTTFNNKTLNQI